MTFKMKAEQAPSHVRRFAAMARRHPEWFVSMYAATSGPPDSTWYHVATLDKESVRVYRRLLLEKPGSVRLFWSTNNSQDARYLCVWLSPETYKAGLAAGKIWESTADDDIQVETILEAIIFQSCN